MKSLGASISVPILAVAAFGQGQVNFSNHVPIAGINAAITIPQLGDQKPWEVDWNSLQHVGFGAYTGARADLMLKTAADTWSRVWSTTFRTSPTAAQPYLNAVTVVVPGVHIGESATFAIWAYTGWFNYQYPDAVSNPVTVILGGGTSVPADLVGLQPFQMVLIPEPATLGLGLLGGGLLCGWGRRQREKDRPLRG